MTTSGKDWRKAREEGVEITFPSGHTARLRPLTLTFLFRLGTLPQFVTGMVMDMLENKAAPISTAEDVQKFYAICEAAARAMFISPRIVDEPTGDDEIGPHDLSDADLEYLWAYLVGQPLAEMKSFRPEPKDAVGTVDTAAGNKPDSE